MASSLALKRLLSSTIIPSSSLRLLSRVAAPSSSASRLFNTNAVRESQDDEVDEHSGLDVDLRRGSAPLRRGDFLSDVFDPFSRTRSLSQVLNMMDQMLDNPFLSSPFNTSPTLSRAWDARETEDALHLRIEMPGLGKEDVKVSVEQNTMIIRGEQGASNEEEESGRKYSSRIDLPEKVYKLDGIKAEMKNGVLRVVVPKVKEEERSDVVHVNVE